MNANALTELVRAFTPICLASIGGIIAVVAIYKTDLPSDRFSLVRDIAFAAISGAAGAAVQGSANGGGGRANITNSQIEKIDMDNNDLQ